jgi:uncharacterized protein YpmS
VSRKFRRLWVILGALAVLVALAVLGLYLAVRHEPAFYRRAMETDRAVLQKASDRMLQEITKVQNAVNRPGRWSVVITAEEINGWLAVDMVKNHPNTLPPTLCDPRVAISPNDVTAGCRYQQGGITSVLSLTLQPSLPEPNVVALRIVRARAGAVRLPLKQVLDGLSQTARDVRIRLDWRQAANDPVAMLSVPDDPDADYVVRIESLQLAEGEIRIAGITERKP